MRLAVQLYTLRAKLAEDVPGTLQALAEAGAEEVELAGLYDRTAEDMRGILDAVGLKAASAHAPLDRLEAEPDAVLEEARTLGVETVIVPWVPTPENDSAADDVVRRIVNAGAAVRDAGFRFGYHNHAFEFGEVDLWSRIVAVRAGPRARRRLAAGRGPRPGRRARGRTPGGCCSCTPRTCGPRATAGSTSSPATASSTSRRSPRPPQAGGASHLVVELDTPSDDPVDDARRSLATLQGGDRVTDLGVGLVGCGKISGIYLDNAPRLDGVRFVACTDVDAERPQQVARDRGLRALADRGADGRPGRPGRALPDAAGLPRRGDAAGDRRGQARLHREAAGDERRRRPLGAHPGLVAPACSSARRRTRSSAPASRRSSRRSTTA